MRLIVKLVFPVHVLLSHVRIVLVKVVIVK